MGETFVNVFVDDIGLMQHQIALDQYGNLVIRIHDGEVFGFVVNIDVFDFKIHAFFV